MNSHYPLRQGKSQRKGKGGGGGGGGGDSGTSEAGLCTQMQHEATAFFGQPHGKPATQHCMAAVMQPLTPHPNQRVLSGT